MINRKFVSVPAPDVVTNFEERRLVAGLLSSVEREAHVSQRKLALELGIALGLVNTYIKRCVNKGLIKVKEVPSRRYAYYLTPHGFTEKSRLTAEYLSWSMTFFRRARMDCINVIIEAKKRDWRKVGFVGNSEFAEIAILTAVEQGMAIAGLVDPGVSRSNIMGVRVFATNDAVDPNPDGWIVTAIENAQGQHDALVAEHGAQAVLAPALLGVRTNEEEGI